MEVAGILGNMSLEESMVSVVAESGALDPLVQLLKEGDEEGKVRSALAPSGRGQAHVTRPRVPMVAG